MNLRFLYMDNLLVTVISFLAAVLVFYLSSSINNFGLQFIMAFDCGRNICGSGRLYGNNDSLLAHPIRKVTAKENEIVSPADGNVIYIKRIEPNETPISIKNGMINEIMELSKDRFTIFSLLADWN